MTITAQQALIEQYTGNGTQKDWPVTFPFLAEQDLGVIITAPDTQQRKLLLHKDYSIRRMEDHPGGTVTVEVPDGHRLTIYLEQPCTQEMDLRNNGILDAEMLEYSLDKLTLLIGQLRDRVGLCVQNDITDTRSPQEVFQELREALFAARREAVTSAGQAISTMEAAMLMAARVEAAAEGAEASAEAARQIAGQGNEDATEGIKGITRLGTEDEHLEGCAGVAAQPAHVLGLVSRSADEVKRELQQGIDLLMTSTIPKRTENDTGRPVIIGPEPDYPLIAGDFPESSAALFTRSVTFTASGTWTAPEDCVVSIVARGGDGGGGGGGGGSWNGTARSGSGGAGGSAGGTTTVGTMLYLFGGGGGGGGGGGSAYYNNGSVYTGGGAGGSGGSGETAGISMCCKAGHTIPIVIGAGGAGGAGGARGNQVDAATAGGAGAGFGGIGFGGIGFGGAGGAVGTTGGTGGAGVIGGAGGAGGVGGAGGASGANGSNGTAGSAGKVTIYY